MNKLDALSLAEKVARDSASGTIREELLKGGNELYESCEPRGRLRRYSPCGDIVEGFLKDGNFIPIVTKISDE